MSHLRSLYAESPALGIIGGRTAARAGYLDAERPLAVATLDATIPMARINVHTTQGLIQLR